MIAAVGFESLPYKKAPPSHLQSHLSSTVESSIAEHFIRSHEPFRPIYTQAQAWQNPQTQPRRGHQQGTLSIAAVSIVYPQLQDQTSNGKSSTVCSLPPEVPVPRTLQSILSFHQLSKDLRLIYSPCPHSTVNSAAP